jgi:hypothetical protein
VTHAAPIVANGLCFSKARPIQSPLAAVCEALHSGESCIALFFKKVTRKRKIFALARFKSFLLRKHCWHLSQRTVKAYWSVLRGGGPQVSLAGGLLHCRKEK